MKKYLIIIASSVILIGLATWIYIQFGGQKKWDIDYQIAPIPAIESYESLKAKRELRDKTSADTYNTAISEKNISLCESITNDTKSDCRDQVGLILAQESRDITSCERLTGTGIIGECRDLITSDIALQVQDISKCSTVSEISRQDLCRERIEGVIYTARQASGTLSSEFCQSLRTKYRSSCTLQIQVVNEDAIYEEALRKKNIPLCETITLTTLRSSCLDTLYMESALSSQDMSLCSKISDPTIVTNCQSQVGKTSDKQSYIDALKLGDRERCTDISHLPLREKCQDTIIISTVQKTGNTALCKSLNNTNIIVSCETIGQP